MTQGAPERKPRRFPLQLDQVATATGIAAPKRPVSSPAGRPPEPLRPQAQLQHIERERRRTSMPQGVGLDSVHVRRRMVERLQADGIDDPRVLEAFSRVPRHLFVDTALVNQAYEDTSLPIGLGQTISKPSVVAAMIQLLCQRSIHQGAAHGRQSGQPSAGGPPTIGRPLGNCLEIGTGCGYQAALLAHLARRVVSIERLRDLHLKARANLDALRRELPQWPDVRLVYGDGMAGHPPLAPYDTIIAAAGGSAVPPAWLDQLAPGGRLVSPIADGPSGGQTLTVVDRLPDGTLRHTRAGAVLFVPLKSGIT